MRIWVYTTVLNVIAAIGMHYHRVTMGEFIIIVLLVLIVSKQYGEPQ